MLKYKITSMGIEKNIEYAARNLNYISLEEKLLSVLSNRVGFTANSLYKHVARDKAIRTPIMIEGTIVKLLQEMELKGYVMSYAEPTEKVGSDLNVYGSQ